MDCKNLLSSGRIGSLTLKNRVIMPAMGDALSDRTGDYIDDQKAYYQERAKGGVGLIITGVCRVDEAGSAIANQFGAYDISQAGGLKKIADGVHRYDSRIFLQLHHAGRQGSIMLTGQQPVGPSAIPVPNYEMPRELTTDEVKQIINKFVFGALIAKMGDFDGVEVHCAHGYLLNQFLSPYSNKRTDEYGGSLENRLRIVKEIIAGIKSQCGPSFPISVRISADEFVEGGISIEEGIGISQMLEQYGADLINVSGGGYQSPFGIIAPSNYKQGWMVPLASAIKKVVKIPVATVSLIRDFDYADNLISNGDVDFVCFGRPNIADPYFVNKLKNNRENEIRPCITCLYCQDTLLQGRVSCSVNPVVGFERDFQTYNKNGVGKVVAVIGGGPGGCEAARVLAIRGYKVVLFEKKNKLGGQVNLAAMPPHKERIGLLSTYYENNLSRLDVEIHLDTEVTVDQLIELNPHAIFIATGSLPIIPPIPGIANANVHTIEQILEEEVQVENKNVLIVGSGNTGLETAEFLLQKGNKITFVDMLPQIGMLASTSGNYTLGALMAEGVGVLPNHMLKYIEGNKVGLLNTVNNENEVKECDAVVLSIGVRSNNELAEKIKDKFKNIKVIADSYQVGNIATSVKGSFRSAFLFENEGDEI